MEVIPAINEERIEGVKRKIAIAESFQAEWAQIDFSDGSFGEGKNLFGPEELALISNNLKLEIDFMVTEPEEKILSWIKTGKIRRVIFHLETLEDPIRAKNVCLENGVEPGISILFSAPEEIIFPFIKEFNFFQVLAVSPGLSGQKFREESLEKIKFLRERSENAKIEVDGGINEEAARAVKEAGADIVASSSFIFQDPDSFSAYKKLLEI